MDNQHRKIRGYRELSQAEIDLMNRIKGKGEELLTLHGELVKTLQDQQLSKINAAKFEGTDEAQADWERFVKADPQRWAALGRTDIERGIMALVRAVAQPL